MDICDSDFLLASRLLSDLGRCSDRFPDFVERLRWLLLVGVLPDLLRPTGECDRDDLYRSFLLEDLLDCFFRPEVSFSFCGDDDLVCLLRSLWRSR